MGARHLTLALLLAPCVPASQAVENPQRVLKTRFSYTASVPAVPKGTQTLRIWLPIPSDNDLQTVTNVKVESALPYQITRESGNGNRMVYVERGSGDSPAQVSVTFDVERKTAGESGPHMDGMDSRHFLAADRLVPITGRFAEIGREVAGPRTGAMDKMRAIYEHVVANMQYDYKKESPKLGQGDVAFVCDYKKGNCSDLHSYLISLARSQGIPAYLEFGFPITGIPLADPIPIAGKISGYHCWTWFYVEGQGWLPVDASDGRRWLDSGRSDIKEKLIGQLVLERSAVAMSVGRDLTLSPPQKAGPLNNFIYPYAEADGAPVEAKWVLTYELLPSGELQDQVNELRRIVIAQQGEIDRLKAERDAAKAAGPKAVAGTASGEAVAIYGQIRVDASRDSEIPNPNSQFPFFVRSPDEAVVGGSNNEQFTMHPRLTRVGFNLKAPETTMPGWAVTGKIEFDFQGGGSESRETPRARLLYVDLKRGSQSWRVGQDWDVISPLWPSPNDDSLMWNAGNLGDRRPQIRFTHDPGMGVSIMLAAGLTGAIDAKDLDANGVRDGEDSGVPGLQARVGVKGTWGSVGVWGHRASEKTTNLVAGRRNFDSSSVGADWTVLLTPKLDLRGEAWTGQNLSDVRGGIGQGVNAATGARINSHGGWTELGMNTSPKHRIALGYTIDDPKDSQIPAGGRTKNRATYLHNRWQLGTNLELGLNVLHWETDYAGLATGKDNRVNVYLSRKY